MNETLEFSLIRKYFTDTYTIGKLNVNQEYLCDTLEDKVRNLNDKNHDGDFNEEGEGKVYGKTAIPGGRYRINMFYWVRHHRLCPLLQDVPGFTGIFIHAGNTAEDTEGCILPGENKAKGQVLYSRYHTNIIEDLIRRAIKEGKEVWITIK
jgi:hypothetical protein